MKDGKIEIPATQGAANAIRQHAKYITEPVLACAERLAIDRSLIMPVVQRRDVEKAICKVHQIPGAEFTLCTLAQSIPVLAHKLGPDWMDKDFDPDRFYRGMDCWSTGERLAGLFLINVWNSGYAKSKGYTFNLFDAVGTLDTANLRPIAEWMLAPVWP